MAEKYHISPTTGNPNRCYASKRPCPLGGEKDHFSSKEEARAAFENRQAAPAAVRKPSKARLEKLAEKHVLAKTFAEFPEKPTAEQLAAASAYAQVHNSLVIAAHRDEHYHDELELQQEYDGTGSDSTEIGAKTSLVALPNGAFVEVGYRAGLDAELDAGWEYHPSLDVHYFYYPNRELAASAMTPNGRGRVRAPEDGVLYHNPSIDTDSVFRETRGNFTGNAFDHWSETSTRRIAQTALDQLHQPYTLARTARLFHSTEKFKPAALTNKSHMGSPSVMVRAATALRPELPKDAHETLLKDPAPEVRAALAGRPDLSRATVDALMAEGNRRHYQYQSVGTPREHMLRNPALPKTVEKKVAREGDIHDLRDLARNPALSEDSKIIMRKRTESLGMRVI